MNCYLCNSNTFLKRKGSARDSKDLKILECKNCGLVTLSSKSQIHKRFYENSNMHGNEIISIDAWIKDSYCDDNRRFNNLKHQLINKKLLDFGCGAGGFLNKTKQITSLSEGVEPELRVQKYWGDSINIYTQLELSGNEYDLITAFHVFEHLIDPIATLKALANKLAKKGLIIIEVPNSEDMLLTLYDSKAFQNFTYWSQHLFFFNAESLQRLTKKAGFKIICIQQYQRYPLSNHLYWLSQGKPGGHQKWNFIDSPELDKAYANSLGNIGKCDTIIAWLELDD